LHARFGGLAFHLDGFIAPDDGVADFEAEGFFLPGVQLGQLLHEFLFAWSGKQVNPILQIEYAEKESQKA